MLIYNTTFCISDEILEDSIMFLKKVYIPQALVSGHLSEPRLALIHNQNEEAGVSYSLQFKVDNIESLNSWLKADGTILHQKLADIFKGQMVGFNTLLEEIELGL